jgi:hypothetical protein
MKNTGTFLISTMCFVTALAQDDTLEEALEEEARRYTVEIIVFSYEENVSIGTELFLPDDPPIEADPLGADGEIAEPIEPPAADIDRIDENDELAEPESQQLEIVLLTEDEFTLTDPARKFDLLDAYKTIMHVGWTQPTYPQEETLPIELRILGDPPEGLDGTFTLYLSRYLHLVVDLALDAPGGFEKPVDTAGSFFRFGDSRAQDDSGFGSAPRPVRYRIQENRILKNGELRYFDHPKFGVLAKVNRVEEDEADDESALEGPLLPTGGQ